MNNKFVAPEDISSKMGDKSNLYELLRVDLGLFLPPYEKCPTTFLKDLLAKKKPALVHNDVKMLPIPKYKELAVKPIWEHVKEVEELAKYFPTLKDNELPDRAFLWGILGTLRREVCQKLIDEARKVRGKNSLENIDDLIEIHPDFLDKIMKAPTLSKNKGRVAFLLKRSKPVRSERKDPKIYSANLRVLSQNSEEEEKQTRQRSLEQFTSHGDDNMNVDIRPENRRTIDPFGQRTTAAQFETPTKREGTSLVKKRFHET